MHLNIPAHKKGSGDYISAPFESILLFYLLVTIEELLAALITFCFICRIFMPA